MAAASYQRYVRGLRLLGEYHGYGCAPTVRTREDYDLATTALERLRSAVIGAGDNTWRESKARYTRARAWHNQLPRPCGVVLYNTNRCQNVGPEGYCEPCKKMVVSVMHRTCERYGIELD